MAQSTVLLVDDSAVVRHSVSILLSKIGFRVVEAEDGKEALRHIADEPPTLVILDIHMPVKGGFDARAVVLGAGEAADEGTNLRAQVGCGPLERIRQALATIDNVNNANAVGTEVIGD